MGARKRHLASWQLEGGTRVTTADVEGAHPARIVYICAILERADGAR